MKDQKKKSRNKSISHHIKKKIYIYLGINLPKETKNLYLENYKTLIKEIKYGIIRWRDISCSCIGRIDIVKINILSKATYRFNANTMKLPMVFFKKIVTKKFTICMETQKTMNIPSNTEKEKQSWKNQPP